MMVRSVIEYGSFIWQGAKSIGHLDAIQRKCPAICLNLLQTAGREAMEVAAGVLPFDLRFADTQSERWQKSRRKSLRTHGKEHSTTCYKQKRLPAMSVRWH